MKIIVTAALPYSYSIPHLGNLVGSILPADVFYKHLRMKGEDAIFICGSDQHGTPIELKAIELKKKPEELANEMHEEIKRIFERFGCTFTHYGKTHSEQNKEIVYKVFHALMENEYIIEAESLQAYCNYDKRFLLDRLIEGICPHCKYGQARGDQCDGCGHLLNPNDLLNPHCRICGRSDISFVKAKNLALALDRLSPEIKKFIEANSRNNWPKPAINKSLSYIKEGLKPRDITRKMKWGFPVPLKGYEDSVFYVWFDAVLGYIGITKEWSERWADYWMSGKTKLIQFMGKDNMEFHTLMWPGILIGSGMGFVLPTTIKTSEYLTSKREKFSKSKGVGLDLNDALRLLPADYWRFALMSIYPETADSEFSLEIMVETVNSLMNDKIGNLLHRTLKLAHSNKTAIDWKAFESVENTAEMKARIEKYMSDFERLELREALKDVVELAGLGNALINDEKPWEAARLAGEDNDAKERFSRILGLASRISYCVSLMLYPFAPNSSSDALEYFGVKAKGKDVPSMRLLERSVRLNLDSEPKPIFRKIGMEDFNAQRQSAP